MEQVGGVIIQVLYTVEDFLWMWGILRMPLTKDKRKLLGAGSIFIILLLLEGAGGWEKGSAIIQMMGRCLLAVFVFEGSIYWNIVKYFFSVFYIGILCTPVNVVFFFIERIQGESGGWYNFTEETVLFLVLSAVSVLAFRNNRWTVWIRRLPLKYYMVGVMIGICISGVSSFTEYISVNIPLKAALVIGILSGAFEESAYILGVLSVYLNELQKKYYWESIGKSALLLQSKEHFDDQRRHMEEVHKIRHDMNTHLQMLQACLNNTEESRAREYLDQILGEFDVGRMKNVDVGNDLVNAVIEGELLRSEDLQVHCIGKLPVDSLIDDYDLCIIFSNLLSNAREACEKLDKSKKVIEIRIRQMKQHFVLEVENPVEWEVWPEKVMMETSKDDKRYHGYGMQNVRGAVEKYGGSLKFPKKEGFFVVSVCL